MEIIRKGTIQVDFQKSARRAVFKFSGKDHGKGGRGQGGSATQMKAEPVKEQGQSKGGSVQTPRLPTYEFSPAITFLWLHHPPGWAQTSVVLRHI